MIEPELRELRLAAHPGDDTDSWARPGGRVPTRAAIEVRRDPVTENPEDIVVSAGGTIVHIERMTDKHIWIRIASGCGVVSVFNLTSKSKINFTAE